MVGQYDCDPIHQFIAALSLNNIFRANLRCSRETQKGLPYPGKRVRGMLETTASNASMIIHRQYYLNHSNSLAAAGAMCRLSLSHYGPSRSH